jgi:fumarylacetoacetate (FAA) hydrolase
VLDASAVDTRRLPAPLPRAWQWLDASAFHSHGDLLEEVFGLDPPPEKRSVLSMCHDADTRRRWKIDLRRYQPDLCTG